MRLPVSHALPLAALVFLCGCGGSGHQRLEPAPPVLGPAADYPMVIGSPFTIGETTYKPADTMNYDAVGYAVAGSEGGSGISAAHKTLPLPSYVEVTSLTSGRTVLVRVERRGPMANDQLLELSPGAAAQLGMAGQPRLAVRVRRVNPGEPERALLRSGQSAPLRMDTPKALLGVLMRKLDPAAAPALPRPPEPPASAAPAMPATAPEPQPAVPPSQAARGKGLVVQAGAFSTRERALAVASSIGATVSHPGRYWLVRLGPFASQGDANAALAKARAAGYTDARIQHAD